MRFSKTGRRGVALTAFVAATTLFAAGCSAGSLGSSSGGQGSAGGTTITWLVGSDDNTTRMVKEVVTAFQAANPGITVKTEPRPGGSDGDNLVKTRLSTGEMAEVFTYNNGSLLSALKPAQNLTAMDDQPWAGQLDKTFKDSTTVDGKLYGGPWGSAQGGAVLYNIPVYKKLGLEIPKTWDEFMNNNEAVKKAGGIAPVEQTYGETWTSQLFVLGDYHNVEAQVPDFAAQYTAGQVKYATTPAALAGFQHIQEVHEAGYFNKDFASAKLNDGIKAIATGTAAHYPQLGGVSANIENVAPGKSKDVGFFPLPGNDAAKNGMTIWPGNGMYIPKTAEGDKLDAAKKLVAFVASQPGCEAQTKGASPTGPYLTTACPLPSDVTQVAKDTKTAIDSGKASPALEFKSPIKGPALEQICIQVGTGQVSGDKGAALYDQDVKKQAQQLGLPGWE
jgi:raffinose/stachyose/melibiose transport system substrate-binding protein